MPVARHPPHTNQSLNHHVLHAGRFGEIILGDQQVALLGNPIRRARELIHASFDLLSHIRERRFVGDRCGRFA